MNITKIFYLVVYILALTGVWYIASTVLGKDVLKQQKIIKIYTESKVKNSSNDIDALINNFSKRFSKFVTVNDIKRSEMEKCLYIIGSSQTPEEYMAYAYTISVIFLILGLLACFINKVTGFAVIACAVVAYIYVIRKLTNSSKKAIKTIDRELPKFVAYVKQALITSNNVLYILESYKTSNKLFARELNQTLGDAKTSNFESACARLDQRVNSTRLKMVINGLRSAYNGDDVKMYFAMLEKDFTSFEINELKKEIKTIPQQILVPKILIYVAAAFALLLPLALTILESFKLYFSSGGITR